MLAALRAACAAGDAAAIEQAAHALKGSVGNFSAAPAAAAAGQLEQLGRAGDIAASGAALAALEAELDRLIPALQEMK